MLGRRYARSRVADGIATLAWSTPMSQIFEAIYENGILRPATPEVGLSEGQRVRVTMDEPPALSEGERKEAELIRRLEARGLVEKPVAPPAPVLWPR